MAIVFNQIEPQRLEMFYPDGTPIGLVNEHEFYDIRIQCREQKKSGIYVMFEGQKCTINKDGRLDKWPYGMFDLFERQLDKLL